jgi:isoleucyl-tRNA synthetase
VPALLETYWLELSRTYIQLTREKATTDDKQLVADLLYTALERVVTLLAPIAPFIAEALWQQLGELVGRDESVHEQRWPTARTSLIDEPLERDFAQLQHILTAGLAAREKMKQGVRWPLNQAYVRITEGLSRYDRLLARHLNVKSIEWNPSALRASERVEPNYATLAKTFGNQTQIVANHIRELQPEPPVTVEGFAIREEHVKRATTALEGFTHAEFPGGGVYLEELVTPDLLEEGFGRELARRIQQLRRDEKLDKRDTIELCITGPSMPARVREDIERKTGSALVDEHFDNARDETIRDRTYRISCRKTI